MTNLNLRKRIKKKSCIWETPSLLTNADRSTDTETKHKSIFCWKKNLNKKMAGGTPAEKEILCKCASIALRKVLACQEILVVYSMFLPNNHISYRLYALFAEMCGGISNRSGNLFYIKNYQMHNLVTSITLANKAPKGSQIMGLFLEKLETFITFRIFFWKSLKNTWFFLISWIFWFLGNI